MKWIKLTAQYVAPQRGLTWLAAKLANCRKVAPLFIKLFAEVYKVNMSEAIEPNLSAYPTFNDFFTRALKDTARPIDSDEKSLVSPADGQLSEFGLIKQGRILQAKGQDFSVGEFLVENEEQKIMPFIDGHFFTFYLAPSDYHRVHFPFDCAVKSMTYIPGKLFSVSPFTAQYVPRLFARNERLVIEVESLWGKAHIILVGAMIVGGIETVWQADIKRSKKIRRWQYDKPMPYSKGQELGRFKLGSTVVLLLEKQIRLNTKDLKANQKIKMGEALSLIKS